MKDRGKQEILNRLRDSMADLDEEGVKKACRDALDVGISPYEALMEGVSKGMEIIGKKYEEGEYFLAELVFAGEIMKEGMNILQTSQDVSSRKTIGKVVMGTVKGDLHDIGKNIVINLLIGAGFDVVDLGVDVPADEFVKSVKRERPQIVGISALLTTTVTEVDRTIRALKDAGVRDKVKVIVGGAPVTLQLAKRAGADAFGKTAVEGVNICKTWMTSQGS